MRARFDLTEVIVREIHLFIQKPECKSSHKYYATAFLNRVAVSVAQKDEKVKAMLFKIYFNLVDFKEEENKVAELVLKGISILISSYKNTEMSSSLRTLIEKET